ncbi:zinc-ribbon domain-containing protein [Methanobrevibacter sp.]|uniref:zinc-ribbon domain-containing protein n=1 Tax=Methanobrevibacter sp. TaxID=66852 RepID=UPI0025CF894B|nr:zinc-ribbon domain-containing protein [Methanobrevibacter sp.]MBQ2831127.1 zinc-ribbon domain-containing protein [Methanobrevibacter sp.]
MSKFCPECGSQVKENVKFCEKCGAQIGASQNSGMPEANKYLLYNANKKSMAVAIIISFFFTGLGIAYAGDTLKGVLYFIGSIVITFALAFVRIRGIIFFIVLLAVWIGGLILTYLEVEKTNEIARMQFMGN